jgi:DNA-binding protein HU-beta
MNKADLLNGIHAELSPHMSTPPSRDTIEAVLIGLAEVTAKSLRAGSDVLLLGIGKLNTRERPAHTGRNPQTGEPVEIPSKVVVTFRPAGGLKQRVNGGAK